MGKAIFKFLLNMLATVIQVIVWPINQIFVNLLPDVSDKITTVTTGISSLFSGMAWAVGMIPLTLKATLLFILTIEVAKHTIWANSHMIIKVWTVLQKIKFW